MKNLLLIVIALMAIYGCKTTPPSAEDYTLQSEAFDAQLQKNRRILIDVRTPAEYDSAHIPGALLIDVKAAGFADKISRLNKKNTYLLYCKSGTRSERALKLMNEAGFKKAYHLYGGIYGYKGQVVTQP
jgi:phage shock protein E